MFDGRRPRAHDLHGYRAAQLAVVSLVLAVLGINVDAITLTMYRAWIQ